MGIERVLKSVTQALKSIRGVRAVVLGGSRASGMNRPDSDVDIGIYYDSKTLDWDALNAAASDLDDERRKGLIGPPGSWGNWVNTGGWLVIDGVPTDLILRDAARVEKAARESVSGVISAHYQPGHPHAFTNYMYLGETAICKILWESDGFIRGLKGLAEPYPAALKVAVIEYYLFEAEFSLSLAEEYGCKGDIYYFSAHIVRSVSALNQALFAANERYCLNEKGAVGIIDGFKNAPPSYAKTIDEIIQAVGCDNLSAIEKSRVLINSVKEICKN